MCERSSAPTCSTWVSACSARMRLKFSWPARFSAIHSRAKSPDWISSRILLHVRARLLGDHAFAARVVAVLGGVGDREAHAREALLVHQVGDQLELVKTLEVRHLGVIAGVHQRLETGLDELGCAAAEDGLLAEQVGLGLVLEARLDHAAARAADALGVGKRQRASVAGRVLLDRDQPWHAAAFGELAPHEVPGALGRDHRHVHSGRRLDLAVVDREAVAEQDHVAFGDAVTDLALPHVVVQLVWQQDHHEVAAAGRLDDGQHLQTLLAGLRDGLRVLAQADHDVDAGVLEVQRVGVALRAVSDDGDGLAVEECEVCIVVVDHCPQAIQPAACRPDRADAGPVARAQAPACRLSQALAETTNVRPGISSVPSAAA